MCWSLKQPLPSALGSRDVLWNSPDNKVVIIWLVYSIDSIYLDLVAYKVTVIGQDGQYIETVEWHSV